MDVDDPFAVREAAVLMGDDESFFRRERGYIIEGLEPAAYWGIFHTCVKEDWLLAQHEFDPPEAGDSPVVDREVMDWDHPWVQEDLKKIPGFKRVINHAGVKQEGWIGREEPWYGWTEIGHGQVVVIMGHDKTTTIPGGW
ncbi:uncharacterized protein PG998_003917 [Apiospora kogelbergensis]|uniref:Uncharacterized protein n=1 Tax=Apiospora kogelbergensis TaxID=1337665 RepID=A0AAW0QJA6_9PEZI